MTERTPIELPVTRVTAFEDRAELGRVRTLPVQAGINRLVAQGLTPLTHAAHLGATVSGGRVERLRLVRRHDGRGGADAARVQAALRAMHAAEDALAAACARRTRAEHRRRAAEQVLGRYAERLAATAWQPDAAPSQWDAHLATLERLVDDATDALRAARADEAEAEAALGRAAAQVDQVTAHHPRPVCDLEIDLWAESAGEVTLAVRALVPCALWRPSHEARLQDDGAVEWTTYATVWQATGEDWRDVELVLSTDRPGAGAELPALSADRLRLQPKVEKKRVVLQHRSEAARKDDGRDAVPGVYDGGEPRRLSPDGPVSVPSDGRPHKVAVGGFASGARVARVCRAELSPHVFWRVALTNTGATPILAGPVTLVRDGAWVGVADVAYVGAGEHFEQSFGSDDRWSVRSRRLRRTEDRLLGRDRTHFVTEVELTWAGAGEGDVELTLRLPVSELRALKVVPSEKWCSEGPPQPDDDGLVRLPLRLGAGEVRTVSLGFTFDTSGDVVLPDPW